MEETIEPKKPIRRKFFRKYGGPILTTLVIVLALTSVYFYRKSKIPDPNKAGQAEIQSLVQKVGRLVVLPTDETPTIATVSDPAALKNQAFFADAKKGDKVLIYSNAKKAILYDPVLDKIITIAPLNIDTTAPVPAPVTTPTTKTGTKS